MLLFGAPPPFPKNLLVKGQGVRLCEYSPFTLVYDHARATAFHMPHITLQGIINGDAGAAPCLAVVSGETCRLLDSAAWNITPARFDDHMRARHTTCMQPGVAGRCLAKGHLFILAAVLANQERKSVTTLHMQGHAASRWNGFALVLFAAFALV